MIEPIDCAWYEYVDTNEKLTPEELKFIEQKTLVLHFFFKNQLFFSKKISQDFNFFKLNI